MPDGEDNDIRYVRLFAWFPTYNVLEREWVWLERYVELQYWSDTSGCWCSIWPGFKVREWHRIVADCRPATPNAEGGS